jgi:SNF2 family DNA or RNA helicase
LRNKKTTRFLGCKNIRATNRWFVSGTPIQNKKEDFYSLCDALGLDSLFYKKEENLQKIRQDYVLYRTKKSVGIVLPDVVPVNYLVPWQNKFEKLISEDIHSLISISGVSSKKSGLFSKHIVDGEGGTLIALLRAKQSCIMPSLMKHIFKDVQLGGLTTGSKVDAVIKKLISRKDNGKGKIVFCQFRQEIDYIAQKLIEKGLIVLTMDGRVKGKKRLNYLKMSADVMILQIQTGCEGLNLQENYSEVYFVSPHWNPSVEDQAVARCHRIGQKKQVQVFRFIMSGFEKEVDEKVDPITLEKYIQTVQDSKRKIADEILV